MARKKATTPSHVGGIEGSHTLSQNIDKLWVQVPVPVWLSVLKEVDPEGQWTLKGKTIIMGRCPYHDDQHPSLSLNFNKKIGKCFAASCGHVIRDIVNLIKKLKKCSYAEALVFVATKLANSGIVNVSQILSDKTIQEMNRQYENQELYKYVAQAANQLLLHYVVDIMPQGNSDLYRQEYGYIENTIDYLRHRNIPLEYIHRYPLGVFGKPIHMRKYIPEKYHESYDTLFAAYNNEQWWGWLLFHYNNSANTISAFKIIKAEKSKNYEKQHVIIKSSDTESIGLLGIYTFRHLLGRDNEVYITEGEFDFLSLVAMQERVGEHNIIIFSNNGTATTDFSFLLDYGIKTIWLIQDHPSKNGDDWAKAILRDKNNFNDTNAVESLDFKIFNWPIDIKGLDLDEVCKDNTYDVIKRVLYTDRSSYFLNSNAWVKERCKEEMLSIRKEFKIKEEKIKEEFLDEELSEKEADMLAAANAALATQLSNLRDTMIQEMSVCFSSWVKLIHSTTDRKVFTQYLSDLLGVELETVVDSTSAYDLNTIDGACAVLLDAIKDNFSFGYITVNDQRPSMVFWSKSKNCKQVVPLGNGHAMREAISVSIGDWKKFADRWLKNSSVYTAGVDDTKNPIDVYARMTYNFVTMCSRVMDIIAHEFNYRDNMYEVGQGIHHAILPSEIQSKGIVYFVNGEKVFKGVAMDNDEMKWYDLNNITDEGVILFEPLGKSERWSSVVSLEDLNQATRIDKFKLYKKIYSILDCWKFENDTIIKQYLACYILAHPIMSATRTSNVTFITGEQQSGKSSLTKGLLAGIAASHSVRSILEPVKVYDSVTPAAIQQGHDKSSLGVIVDEHESDKGSNNKEEKQRKANLLADFYNIPFSQVNIARGSASGGSTRQHALAMPVILSGITPPENAVFLSRLVMIHTKKDKTIEDPALSIANMFTPEEIDEIRKEVTLAFLNCIPRLAQEKNQLKMRLKKLKWNNKPLDDRFVTITLGAIMIWKELGFDPEELMLKMYSIYATKIEQQRNNNSFSNLLETIFLTRCVTKPTDGVGGANTLVSIESLLRERNFGLINQADLGLLVVPEKNWIIIDWNKARYGILVKTPYADTLVTTLIERLSKLSCVIKGHDNEARNLLLTYQSGKSDRLKAGKTPVSVLNLAAILDTAIDVLSLDMEEDGFIPQDVEQAINKFKGTDSNIKKDEDPLEEFEI